MDLLFGPLLALRALQQILSTRRLRWLSLVPALIALLLTPLGLFLALHYAQELLLWLWPQPPSGLFAWLWQIFHFFSKIGAWVVGLLLMPWLVMLFGLPLCEPLAGAVDELNGGRAAHAQWTTALWRSLTSSVGVLLFGLAGTVALLILGLIPGLSLITTPLLTFVWTPFILAFDLVDGALCRRQLGFFERLGLLLRHPFLMISVGLTGGLLVSVPFLNLLGLPVAVAMGSLAIRRLELRRGAPIHGR